MTPAGTVSVIVTAVPTSTLEDETPGAGNTGWFLFTVWVSGAEVAAVLFASPEYDAVTVCEPAVSDPVVSVATPFTIVPVPSTVVPSRKVTVPVALVGTEAVNVTGWLVVEGFVDEVNATVGVALITACVAEPVAGLFPASPPYEALIGSEPTGNVVVVIVTVPFAPTMPVPSVVVPLVSVTVPVVPAGRVEVIVTGAPNVLGPEVVTVSVGVPLFTVWVSVATEVPLFASPL